MIEWAHDMWQEWGRQMRRNHNGWPSKSIEWHIWMEQGVSAPRPGSRVPHVEFSTPEFKAINNIWHTLSDEMQNFAWTFYVKRWRWQKKAEKLGTDKNGLYKLRDGLLHYTAGRLHEMTDQSWRD